MDITSLGPLARPIRRVVSATTTAVGELPHTVDTWRRVGQAVVTGERTPLPGRQAPYPTLDPAALAAAKARGAGRTVKQDFIGAQDGADLDEPVNILVRGREADLVAALERAGWTRNADRTPLNYLRQVLSTATRLGRVTEGPVSDQYLDGKDADMAFSKNSDFNVARDHLRIYKRGVDPATGEALWAIAATRDTDALVTVPRPRFGGLSPRDWHLPLPRLGHAIDPDVDRERDLIMHDLLGTGLVAGWDAVTGVRAGVPERPLPDGRLEVGGFRTDGLVYEVRLRPISGPSAAR